MIGSVVHFGQEYHRSNVSLSLHLIKGYRASICLLTGDINFDKVTTFALQLISVLGKIFETANILFLLKLFH